MTDRKPDFWVIKSNSADMGYFERPGVWTRNKKTRARFSTEGEAIAVAYTGRVVPVYCTSKRAEPKMRERSSSWVLKRLAEGKVVMVGVGWSTKKRAEQAGEYASSVAYAFSLIETTP